MYSFTRVFVSFFLHTYDAFIVCSIYEEPISELSIRYESKDEHWNFSRRGTYNLELYMAEIADIVPHRQLTGSSRTRITLTFVTMWYVLWFWFTRSFSATYLTAIFCHYKKHQKARKKISFRLCWVEKWVRLKLLSTVDSKQRPLPKSP